MTRTHKYAPWRRAILAPIWTVQLGSMALILALLIFAAAYLFNYSYDSNGVLERSLKITLAIWCSLSAFCALLTISNIILLTRRKLRPLGFFIVSAIQSAIWTVLFVIDIISWARQGPTAESALGVVIEIVILLSFYSALVYAVIIFRRQRKEKKYSPVGQPTYNTAYHSHTVHNDLENQPHSYGNQTSGVAPAAYDPYKPSYNAGGDIGLAHQQDAQVPQYHAPQQPNVFEMESRRH